MDEYAKGETDPTPSSILRPPSFRRFLPPWWTLGFPLLGAAGVAAWRAAGAADGESALGVFFLSLIWPGVISFVAVLVFVLLGWNLDID
jgi:hypothetical protein